jgi:hypothetical protein
MIYLLLNRLARMAATNAPIEPGDGFVMEGDFEPGAGTGCAFGEAGGSG